MLPALASPRSAPAPRREAPVRQGRALDRLVLLVCLSAPFWGLFHPLLEVDDARYAQIPAEMVRSGDWLTPTLNGLDYVEKPPLWYWLCAASYSLFGVGEWQARLPLALLSALGAAGAAWLGGWAAGAALAVAPLWFALSGYITPDLPLAVFLLWCTAFILKTLDGAAWAAPWAWACAALAVLSKGVVGLLFPAVWTVLLCAEPRRREPARALLRPLGPALFVLIAGPWFAAMSAAHPDFARVFFWEQHVERFLTPRYNRPNPWWLYLAVLPASVLPFLPEGRGRGDKPLLLWVALVAGFFSLSSSKLISYAAPAVPHLVLLLRPRRLWPAALLCLAAVVAVRFAPFSARDVGRHVAARLEPGDEVWTYGLYLHGLPFYAGAPVARIINWTGELDYARRRPGSRGRFGADEQVMDLLPRREGRTFVVFRTFEAPYFTRLSFPGDASYARFGEWTVAEFVKAR